MQVISPLMPWRQEPLLVHGDTHSRLSNRLVGTISWTNTDLLSIRPLGTHFNEIQIKIQNFSFIKMHLKMLSAKWQPFSPGEDGLKFKHHCATGCQFSVHLHTNSGGYILHFNIANNYYCPLVWEIDDASMLLSGWSRATRKFQAFSTIWCL